MFPLLPLLWKTVPAQPQYLDFLSQGVPPLPQQPPAAQAVAVVGQVGLVAAAHVDGDHHLGPHGPGHVSWGQQVSEPLCHLPAAPGADTDLHGSGVAPEVAPAAREQQDRSAHGCPSLRGSKRCMWHLGTRVSAGEWLASALEGSAA